MNRAGYQAMSGARRRRRDRLTLDETMAVLWAAVGKIGANELRRDLLPAGLREEIHLRIAGQVAGRELVINAACNLTVAEDSVRTASQAPPWDHLVGYLLGQLPQRTAERIVRELPEEFVANGNKLPSVAPEWVAAAESLAGRLRAKVQQEVRGAVACGYALTRE